MINPDLEINRLRTILSNRQLPNDMIEDICRDTTINISTSIETILNNAIDECILYAQSIGANDFVNTMHVSYDGNSYSIGTTTGKTDFSKERVEMLPHLLKNAKVAQDGSKYRIIPIKDKENQVPTSIFDSMIDRQMQTQQQRSDLMQQRRDRWNNINSGARQTVSIINQDLDMTSRLLNQNQKTNTTTNNFKTASSKQDPHEKWVIGKQDRDMTSFLMDVNNRINNDISSIISNIIYEVERGY
jgi:hypothetical protein